MVDKPSLPLDFLFRYSTIQGFIDDIESGDFNLPPQLLNVAPPMGYSSPKIRELLNRLVGLNTKDMTYLEVGVHTGSTFFAAAYLNRSKAIAIDNWTLIEELGPPGGAKNAFMDNLNKALSMPGDKRRISYIDHDAFSVELAMIPMPVTIYFYDGDHGRTAQYKALTYYAPVLADRFIYMVDDFNWAEPREETYHAIRDLGYNIVHEWVLKSRTDRDMEQWWNGFFIGIIEKGKNV